MSKNLLPQSTIDVFFKRFETEFEKGNDINSPIIKSLYKNLNKLNGGVIPQEILMLMLNYPAKVNHIQQPSYLNVFTEAITTLSVDKLNFGIKQCKRDIEYCKEYINSDKIKENELQGYNDAIDSSIDELLLLKQELRNRK